MRISSVLMSLQMEHFPHGSVGPTFLKGGSTSFLMTLLRTVVVLRKATIGGSLKIFRSSGTFYKMLWCCFIIPGSCASPGCQSHTNTVVSFSRPFIVLSRISSLDFWLISFAAFINFFSSYPRFMKYFMYLLHCSMKSDVSLHIRRNRRNWDLGMLLIMCFGWFDVWLR